mmetsp:Transcript_3560/g.8361  ORF Transcript_3560/g.8361 Transcript_3560/m.8361 type:complete len:226 (-) Transcript_3560:342-1019(-)
MLSVLLPVKPTGSFTTTSSPASTSLGSSIAKLKSSALGLMALKPPPAPPAAFRNPRSSRFALDGKSMPATLGGHPKRRLRRSDTRVCASKKPWTSRRKRAVLRDLSTSHAFGTSDANGTARSLYEVWTSLELPGAVETVPRKVGPLPKPGRKRSSTSPGSRCTLGVKLSSMSDSASDSEGRSPLSESTLALLVVRLKSPLGARWNSLGGRAAPRGVCVGEVPVLA